MKHIACFFVFLAIISSSSHGTIPESKLPLSEAARVELKKHRLQLKADFKNKTLDLAATNKELEMKLAIGNKALRENIDALRNAQEEIKSDLKTVKYLLYYVSATVTTAIIGCIAGVIKNGSS